MARHNRKLSFTTPILVGFAGILLSFLLIAAFVTATQKKNFLEDYHHVNRNFTHNLAINYTESLLRVNDHILTRATTFFSRNDELNKAVNLDPQKGLRTLMQLQDLMQTVSSISLADTQAHYLRAPEVLETEDSRSFDPESRPWFIKQAEASMFSLYTRPYLDYFTHRPSVTLYLSPGDLPGRTAQRQPRLPYGPDIDGARAAANGGSGAG